MAKTPRTLRLLLGDQLNARHSWLAQTDDQVWYVLFEMRQETDYVQHHIQKVVAFFLAMRTFAEALREAGHQVVYWKLDDQENSQSLPDNLATLLQSLEIKRFEYQLPDEYRLDQQLQDFCAALDIPYKAVDTEHFLTTRTTLSEFFKRMPVRLTACIGIFSTVTAPCWKRTPASGWPTAAGIGWMASNERRFWNMLILC